jgi:molybdenum cofactor biosynthesis protein A
MPEEGIHYLPKKELLTFEEIIRLVSIMGELGISKIRLTGGEPFVRNDLMQLMTKLVAVPGIRHLHLTTNGVLTQPHIPELKSLGIASVNLSLDTLDKERFKIITRRNEFDKTVQTLEALLRHQIPVKVNTVVMDGKNTEDIVPLAALTKEYPIAVRFIEEMPFNGDDRNTQALIWNHKKIYDHLLHHFPGMHKISDPENSTAFHYQVPGYRGQIGIIAAWTRTFCGTCNRLRVTAQGVLKTCLYDNGVLNIKDLLRSGIDDGSIKEKLLVAFRHRAKDGFEAEANRTNREVSYESMSTIGG